jgi:hypothetical protein
VYLVSSYVMNSKPAKGKRLEGIGAERITLGE